MSFLIKVRVLVVLFLIVILSACAIGPDFTRPPMDMPAKYRDLALEGSAIANWAWWEIFKDKDLQNLIRIALENNKELGAAVARIEQAQATLGVVRADQFPTIDISGQAVRSEASENALAFLATPINNFGLFGNLSFELDIWGKLRRATEAERAVLLSTEYAHRSIAISLIAAVADTYFNIIGQRHRLGISKGTYENRKGATKLINERFTKGIVPQLDLNQAQIEEATAAVAVTVVERNLRQSEHALSVLLGQMPSEIKINNDLISCEFPSELPSGYPADLLERRPDVRSAEETAHAAVARIGVAQALRLPGLNLTGFIGLQSLESNDLFKGASRTWSLGGTFLGPLLDFGRSSSNVDLAEARAKEAVLAYEQTVLQAVREVEDSIVAIRTARDAYQFRDAQVAAAQNAAKLARARYDEGVSQYLEVLDIERSLFEAELGASSERQFYLTSVVQLYKALGGGWETSTEEDAAGAVKTEPAETPNQTPST